MPRSASIRVSQPPDVAADDPGLGPLREPAQVHREAPHRLLAPAGLVEPLGRELAHRLQHPEAGLAAAAGVRGDEAVTDQGGERLENVLDRVASRPTASAASSEKPPAKTDSRRSSERSARPSSA